MGKPFDVSKFRKDITKSIDGLSIGFNDPTDWISTGNYALNYLISGDFNKGVPLGKVTVFAGESGAGKSYFASGNIIKAAQAQGIFVVLIDSEIVFVGKWEFRQIRQIVHIIRMHARRIKAFMIHRHIVIGMTQRPFQTVQLQRTNFVDGGDFDWIKVRFGWR